MNPLLKYVLTLPEDELLQIINDYEQFEKDGYIGGCLLRYETGKYLELYDIPQHHIVMMMETFIKEVFRYFAYKQLKRNLP